MAHCFPSLCSLLVDGTLRRFSIRLLLVIGFGMLAACSVNISDYRETRPVLDLRDYLQDELTAWGIFQSRYGKVKRHFKVNIKADWNGDVCTLREQFQYDDGEEQQRTWTITRHDAHHYTGTAGDVIGEARGIAYGNALNWHYRLKVPIENSVYTLRFNDWMYLIDDKVLINRAKVTKFGIKVAEVTLFFQKQ